MVFLVAPAQLTGEVPTSSMSVYVHGSLSAIWFSLSVAVRAQHLPSVWSDHGIGGSAALRVVYRRRLSVSLLQQTLCHGCLRARGTGEKTPAAKRAEGLRSGACCAEDGARPAVPD